jgi:hypothetical protein
MIAYNKGVRLSPAFLGSIVPAQAAI